MQIRVNLPAIGAVQFEIEAHGHGRAFFVLGIRKSGSTLLNRTCAALARNSSVNYVDIAGTFFQNNIPVSEWVNERALRKVLRPGNAYGGFRNMPMCFTGTGIFTNAKKVLLVRDPRDALVSEFFSNAYSHSMPAKQAFEMGATANIMLERRKALQSTIEEYVFSRVPLMRRTFLEYRPITTDPNALILKYEEVVFRKREMIDAILKHFRWECAGPAITKLLDKVDVRPVEEDPTAFIRKVTPGDHREKLSSRAIAELNTQLREVMDLFGYSDAA
ncbi:MAG TPA: sulfotransferase domain-containing protein [Rhizomicrobium sp.]|nr:sulfotransferase domain-containing protein [Rhizomicrobium sp.]